MSSVAAALLLTTTAASAPVSCAEEGRRRAGRVGRGGRCARSNSSVEYPRATSATRSMAACDSGARPRFVWMITPVALMTRRSEPAKDRAGAARRAVRGTRPRRPALRAPAPRPAGVARSQARAQRLRLGAQRLDDGVAAEAALERAQAGPLAQLFDGRNDAGIRGVRGAAAGRAVDVVHGLLRLRSVGSQDTITSLDQAGSGVANRESGSARALVWRPRA